MPAGSGEPLVALGAIAAAAAFLLALRRKRAAGS
jgi:LPXTG-motif cell wall-anchored protein